MDKRFSFEGTVVTMSKIRYHLRRGMQLTVLNKIDTSFGIDMEPYFRPGIGAGLAASQLMSCGHP